ncbi:helix-turn-helix domain-containing protein [Blautia schinkii]|nr:helix-turn-helix domain-containing protein [Blautia schinkii]
MNIIRRKRKELGISQKELSEKLGTSQQTISRIEKADIENIPCNLLVKLANIFNTPIDILVHGENSDLCRSQIEELWDVFQRLDEINKATLLLMGRRLNEAQLENMLKKQLGDISDKNSHM